VLLFGEADEQADGAADGGTGPDLGAQQRNGVLDLVGLVVAEHVVKSCCVRDTDEVVLLAQLEQRVEERCELGRFGLVERLPAGSANRFAGPFAGRGVSQ
jgi:hypothetical protein